MPLKISGIIWLIGLTLLLMLSHIQKKGREVYSLALELYEFLKSKSPTILTAKSALDVAANMIEQNSKVN